jgi:hypothetical protein
MDFWTQRNVVCCMGREPFEDWTMAVKSLSGVMIAYENVDMCHVFIIFYKLSCLFIFEFF